MTGGGAMQQGGEIPQKHSALGIASFIVALAAGMMTALTVLTAGVLTLMGPEEEPRVGFMIVGLIMAAGLFGHLVGTGLGIAGLVQKNRKKVFSVLGVTLNAAAIIVVVSLMIIGWVAG